LDITVKKQNPETVWPNHSLKHIYNTQYPLWFLAVFLVLFFLNSLLSTYGHCVEICYPIWVYFFPFSSSVIMKNISGPLLVLFFSPKLSFQKSYI
jgi:hypothetical protein